MEPEAKRTRLSQSPSPGSEGQELSASSPIPPKCHLTSLPLELVAEVLSYVPSTRDVLAVTRTCKHFCNVLANNKATDFIWRQARARSPPQPIPDPTPNFPEASYAAFLFDSKTCEVLR